MMLTKESSESKMVVVEHHSPTDLVDEWTMDDQIGTGRVSSVKRMTDDR